MPSSDLAETAGGTTGAGDVESLAHRVGGRGRLRHHRPHLA
jgi:hypothetical protein